jgi:hypothetical protein
MMIDTQRGVGRKILIHRVLGQIVEVLTGLGTVVGEGQRDVETIKIVGKCALVVDLMKIGRRIDHVFYPPLLRRISKKSPGNISRNQQMVHVGKFLRLLMRAPLQAW